MQTKKGIGHAIIFALIACFLITVISLCFRQYSESGYQYEDTQEKRDELINVDDPMDILFFGDSIAWAAFNPEVFWETNGILTYNCATSGQWVGDGKIILNTALEKLHPEIIVWDANSIYTRISRVKYHLSKYFSVFHYHFAYLYQSTPGEKDPLRGFNSSEAINSYTGNLEYMSDMAAQPFTDLAEEKLEEIYDICKKNNVTLVVTCSPNPNAWNMGRHKAVADWCSNHGVDFIDYNLLQDEIGIDWSTDTRDGGEHLNNSGAYKVCRHLSDYLKNNYNLQSHSNDPACSEWIKDYGEVKS